MKISGISPQRSRGYTAIPVVAAISVVMLTSVTYIYRMSSWSHDNQAKSQVKVDYSQKEEALLNALVNVLPNKAIGAMREGSASAPALYTWESVFSQSLQLADAGSVSVALEGASGAISGNTGNAQYRSMDQLISPLAGSGLVNPGAVEEQSLMLDSRYLDLLPAPLSSNTDINLQDRVGPLITTEKHYVASSAKGLRLNADTYPLYNVIPYPNIQFGYARPGDPFLAKRNWWAFSVRYGTQNPGMTGLSGVTKKYLLSLYEVPSQLPLSAGVGMIVGQHENGSDWRNVGIEGGVFASRLQTAGTVDLMGGLFSARRSVNLGDQSLVDGQAIRSDFDSMGVREEMRLQNATNFYAASVGGNVGRVAFIPLVRGHDFLQLMDDGNRMSRISPTGWNEYSNGALQCRMRVRVLEMESDGAQRPIAFELRYLGPGGAPITVSYRRGSNWPAEGEIGGSTFPFQTEFLPVGRHALIFHPQRLPAFLQLLGNAGGPTVNNSIYIYPDPAANPTVRQAVFPSTSAEMAVVIREAEDLSPYTKGFSLVTNCRLYIGDSMNTVAIPGPSGAGLPAGKLFYPPLSLYAVEKRYGTSTEERRVQFDGQLTSLNNNESETFNPVDLKSGTYDSVDPSRIQAQLHKLVSPAELPPIFLMNWLVTIEEIH